MNMNDVIREAHNEHEVYFLLTSYVEAVRYGDLLCALPAPVRELPLSGVEDVKKRLSGLQIELARSWDANEETRVVVQEAVDLFGEALNRLQCLQWEKRRASVMAA